MALIDPVLLGVTLGVVALTLLVVFGLGTRVRRASTRVQAAVGLLASAAERTLNTVRTVRAANATCREEETILGHAARARTAGLQSARVAAVMSPVSGIATPGAGEAECLSVLGTVNLMGLVGRDERGLDAEVGPNGITLSGWERQELAEHQLLA